MRTTNASAHILAVAVSSPGISRYRLAKETSYPNSTVYYWLSRLEREGLLRVEGGSVRPTLRGVLEYVELFGCDSAAARAAASVLGLKAGDDLCGFLELLRRHREKLDGDLLAAALASLGEPVNLEKIKRLDGGAATAMAKIVSERLPAASFAGHRGIFFVDVDGSVWFLGYCEICGEYVSRGCDLVRVKYLNNDKS